jgi:hypothetical protein
VEVPVGKSHLVKVKVPVVKFLNKILVVADESFFQAKFLKKHKNDSMRVMVETLRKLHQVCWSNLIESIEPVENETIETELFSNLLFLWLKIWFGRYLKKFPNSNRGEKAFRTEVRIFPSLHNE